MYRRSSQISVLAVLVGLLAILAVGIGAQTAIWYLPASLLDATGVDWNALGSAVKLDALRDARMSVATLVAGIATFAVAYAALWQAHGARMSRSEQVTINWAEAYVSAVERLSAPSSTTRFSGVVALRALAESGQPHAARTVRDTLASFIRACQREGDDEAVLLALDNILDRKHKSGVTLAGANLSSLDLHSFDFSKTTLDKAIFRESTLPLLQQDSIQSAASTDLHDVRWK
jgi:hypothetical protein